MVQYSLKESSTDSYNGGPQIREIETSLKQKGLVYHSMHELEFALQRYSGEGISPEDRRTLKRNGIIELHYEGLPEDSPLNDSRIKVEHKRGHYLLTAKDSYGNDKTNEIAGRWSELGFEKLSARLFLDRPLNGMGRDLEKVMESVAKDVHVLANSEDRNEIQEIDFKLHGHAYAMEITQRIEGNNPVLDLDFYSVSDHKREVLLNRRTLDDVRDATLDSIARAFR